jgi:hypothetical protein
MAFVDSRFLFRYATGPRRRVREGGILKEKYPFRGIAGETVHRLLGYSRLLQLGPGLVLVAALLIVSMVLVYLLKLPPYLSMLVSLTAASPVIGKCAFAAAAGELEGSFLSGWDARLLWGFVQRHAVLSVAWSLPVYLAGTQLIPLLIQPAAGSGAFLSARGAMGLLTYVILGSVVVVAPSLVVIVATRTQSIPECFSRDAWAWLFSRLPDLATLFALLLGGTAVFAALNVPPLLILAALAFSVHLKLGLAVTAFTVMLPGLAGAILLGRLAGGLTFSAGHVPENQALGVDAPVPNESMPTPTKATAAPSGIAANDLARTIGSWGSLPDDQVESALREAESLRANHPKHPGLLSELAKLYVRAGRKADAVATASQAISNAMASNEAGVAVATYSALAAQRADLVLTGEELEQLGRALLEQKRFSDAAWVLSTSAGAGGPKPKIEKGLVAAADGLSKAGQLPAAARVYQYLVNYFPGSPGAEYSEQMLAALRIKMGKPQG